MLPSSSLRINSLGLDHLLQASLERFQPRFASWRRYSSPMSLEDEFLSVQSNKVANTEEDDLNDSPEDPLSKPLSPEEVNMSMRMLFILFDFFANVVISQQLKSLLANSERTKLIKKLSEANQQNRFLKRQLYGKEDALVKFKSELAVMELEVQALVALAEEIAKSGIPEGSRRINGKYIHSHLLSRLEAICEKLKEQIKDVDAAQSNEVPVSWVGMAESVQVMGSFDGWSQGEHLSPEYTGSYTKFSTTLMLRPGRYEIKFLVDGEWRLSPEFPTVGEGLMENNLLIVK
ncbi:AMP-activated protein kinase, glycogen-binding domain [Dillenia turbinata]|uniref:AMP-activated protein kinase, glycogen-binding domain n=1 Tax=Dillenia turbinata TaxID=194707 RepID=A0AAN8VHP9_9MAGN